jgi:tetratricopeptide (TPR) repeat protein
LVVDREDVDAQEFATATEAGRRSLAAGDTEAAHASLTHALALWRGPAYAEFSGCPTLESEAARLHQLRVDARQWLLEAELAGPAAPPVAAIEALVREHPTREGLWVLLMKALYRSGRQADALKAYRRARRFLLEELGVEPSRELRDTEQLILTQDATLDGRGDEPGPAQAPAPPSNTNPDRDPHHDHTELRERRVISVVALDLPTGVDLDAEDIAGRAASFRDLVRERIAAYDGTVYAELDGLVLAAFGARRSRSDDASRALRAAAGVLARSSADPLPRAGITTGETLVVSTGNRTEISGPLIATAEQLRSAARPGDVLVDDATRPMVEEVAELEAAPSGSGWRVTSLAAAHRRRAPGTPFVGREQDLALLRATLDKAMSEGRPQLVTIEGEAGIGKSRLVREFEARVATDGVAVTFHLVTVPPGADAPLAPIADIVRSAAGIAGTAGLEETAGAIRSVLPADELDALFPRLLALVGGETDAAASLGESLEVWRRFIEIAAERATVIVIEDLHWASDVVLDFIESLPAHVAPRPLLVIGTTRPELYERRAAWGTGSGSLVLAALSTEQTEALIDHLSGETSLSIADRAALIERSGGVPLFAEELTRLRHHEPGHAADNVPPILSAVISARIDRLPANSRAVLSSAALAGPDVWSDQVAAIAGITEAEAIERLDELAERAFMDRVRPSRRSGHRQYVATHELVRSAAEQRLTREDRAHQHLAAYAWWTDNIDDARDAHAALLAHHACSAYDLAAAAGLDDLLPMAREAAGSSALVAGQQLQGIDIAAALRFLGRAVDLIDPEAPDHARAVMWFGGALLEDRQYERAERALSDALKRLEDTHDPLLVEAILFLITCRFIQGKDLGFADAAIDRARAILPASRPAIRILSTSGVLRLMEQTTESLHAAITIADEAIALAATYRTGGDALAHVVRGRARLSLGDEDGLRELEDALDEVSRTEPGTIAMGTRQWHAGAMHHWRGPAAERASRDALEALAERRGMQSIASMGIAEDVRVAYELGELQQAIALADGIPGDRGAQPRWAVVQKALALLDLHEIDDDVVREVTGTPPADDGDLRHVLGSTLVVTGAALLGSDHATAVAALEGLGDLHRFVERDGAVELLPRLVRTALAVERPELVAQLDGIDEVATPLRRLIAETVEGLLAESRGDVDTAVAKLSAAAAGWDELDFRAEAALTRADLVRVLRGADGTSAPV